MQWKHLSVRLLTCFILAGGQDTFGTLIETPRKPNIVVIVANNLGYPDVLFNCTMTLADLEVSVVNFYVSHRLMQGVCPCNDPDVFFLASRPVCP